MAEAIVSNVVTRLLEYLGQSVADQIAPYFGGTNKLKELADTMRMIQARLFDAEKLREDEGGALIKEWLKRLKHVLYRLEDLFEDATLIDKGMHMHMTGNNFTDHFRSLVSRSSSVMKRKKLVQESKDVLNKFKGISSDMLSLNLRVVHVHSVEEQHGVVSLTNKRETYSFVFDEKVIGRDEDKKAIMQMVLCFDDEEGNLGVIPIIGIGGLGKTTLAQLVFNDKDVDKHFEIKGWACISEISSFEELARKVLRSITKSDCVDLGLEQLQMHLQEAVIDRKYLLVLDDIWDENRERWLRLKQLLCGGKRGSKIVITSRSRVVAVNMGTTEPYELKGLSEDKSWELFRNLALKEGQEEMNPNLTNIGREIVKKCANVPLAIRATASLLYSKDTEIEWESFKDGQLRMIEQSENNVMSTLKLSYDHLQADLKQCFAYGSLFPKDYEWLKQDLIYLWMAQGYIRSSRGSQSSWEVGHGYFMELLRRSFFQEFDRDENGEIMSCKMHDLMHDLAQFVAGGDTLLLEGSTEHIRDNVLHVSCIVGSSWEAPPSLLAFKLIRSVVLLSSTNVLNIDDMFSSLRFIRALDLAKADCEILPNSIGELKHLRYLKLSFSTVSLPKWITKLKNLQTLDLRPCFKRRELPNCFTKLITLRHLHNPCRLIDMPPRFGELSSLSTLDVFIVGKNNGLDALASLSNLAGMLEIHFNNCREQSITEAMTANLEGKKLTGLVLKWLSSRVELVAPANDENDELSLKCLLPPPSLKSLQMEKWMGVRFPSWGMDEIPCFLPNLVTIRISYCKRCQQLPPFYRLPLLRSLELQGLKVVEYIEIDSNSKASPTPYFPSLESLVLDDLPKLKRWMRAECALNAQKSQDHQCFPQPFFPRLSYLKIVDCLKVMSMPLVPMIVSLKAHRVHGKLLKFLLSTEESRSPSPSSFPSTHSLLREMRIESIHELVSFSINDKSSLESLRIENCQELISFTAESLCSLRRLEVVDCGRLTNISGALQHLSIIRELKFWDCGNFDLLNSFGDAKSKWEGLKSLRSLVLGRNSSLESLPKGLGCITKLQDLYIYRLDNLRALPDWIGNLTQLCQLYIQDCNKLMALPQSFGKLTSLQKLSIKNCTPELRRRCQRLGGEDWPLIQQIPDICLG